MKILSGTYKYFLLLIFVSLFNFSNAQMSMDIKGGNVSLSFVSGVQMQPRMQWKEFDNFLNSYNSHYSELGMLNQKLITPLSKTSFVWGVEANLATFQTSFRFANFDSRTINVLKNNEAHIFDLDMQQFKWTLGLLVPIGDYVGIGYGVGLSMYRGNLLSGYRYADGTVSYAEDKATNGIFTAHNTGEFLHGPRLEVGYKWVKLGFLVEHVGGKIIDSGEKPYSEVMYGNSSVYNFNDGNLKEYLDNSIVNGHKGWTFSIVLKLSPIWLSLDD